MTTTLNPIALYPRGTKVLIERDVTDEDHRDARDGSIMSLSGVEDYDAKAQRLTQWWDAEEAAEKWPALGIVVCGACRCADGCDCAAEEAAGEDANDRAMRGAA